MFFWLLSSYASSHNPNRKQRNEATQHETMFKSRQTYDICFCACQAMRQAISFPNRNRHNEAKHMMFASAYNVFQTQGNIVKLNHQPACFKPGKHLIRPCACNAAIGHCDHALVRSLRLIAALDTFAELSTLTLSAQPAMRLFFTVDFFHVAAQSTCTLCAGRL